MKDFTKIGDTYIGNTPVIALALVILVLLAGLYVYIIKSKKKGHESNDEKKMYILILTAGAIAAILSVTFITITSPHQDYKGRFEIVETNTDIVKSDDDEAVYYYAVLKDRAGNKQEFEVKKDDGVFQKGEYADVTVAVAKHKSKPKALAEPINSGGYEVKKIKQVEK